METTVTTRISRRLERAEALRDRATTEGERCAAAAACERLQKRLMHELQRDPVRRHVLAEFDALIEDDAPMSPNTMHPWRDQLLRQLARWENGTLRDSALRQWTQGVVDRNLLPSDPDDIESFWADVVLQLASGKRGVLCAHHVPSLKRFLRHEGPPPWEAWFGWLDDLARSI